MWHRQERLLSGFAAGTQFPFPHEVRRWHASGYWMGARAGWRSEAEWVRVSVASGSLCYLWGLPSALFTELPSPLLLVLLPSYVSHVSIGFHSTLG